MSFYPLNFTPEALQKAYHLNRYEEWIDHFLMTVGDNRELAQGLKLETRYWIKPQKLLLSKLNRCCGPESEMEFLNARQEWETRIKSMHEAIFNNWVPPPLICEYTNNKLIIRDGNHRFEALKLFGFEEYWAAVWCNTEKDYAYFSSL
ncbi:MAG: ParB domain protein nuclease [Chlamydiales bacterium]|jgi:hypothetical protein|nr:ParB domain protein nuclease [Chlamydiales bacterium]